MPQVMPAEILDPGTLEGGPPCLGVDLDDGPVNMLMIVYYQAETGHATKHDFLAAKAGLRQSLKSTRI